jgi:hypothetical protein
MNLKKITLLFMLGIGLTFSLEAAAKDIDLTNVPPQDIPAMLDFELREAPSYRFQLSPYGGDFFGDQMNHNFIVGGDFQFNITQMLGVAVDLGWNQVNIDRSTPFGATFTDNNEFLINSGFVITVPAAYRSKTGFTEADFFTSIGGGVNQVNGQFHGAGYIGGGMIVRLRSVKWLGIRVEIRNYFTSVNNPAGSDFEDDLTIGVGPTFYLPPEF